VKSYLRALRYLWPYKWLLVVGGVLSIVASVLEVATMGSVLPFLKALSNPEGFSSWLDAAAQKMTFIEGPILRLREIVESDLPGALAVIVLGAGALTLLKNMFDFVGRFAVHYTAQRAILDMRSRLYDKVVCLPLRFFTESSIGDLLSRFTNDFQTLIRGFTVSFVRFVREPAAMLVAFAAAVVLDWKFSQLKLTLMALIAVPLAGWSIRRLARRIRRSSARALETRAQIVSMLEDTMSGIKVVKVSQMERGESTKLRALQKRLLREVAKVIAAENALGPVVEVIGIASLVLLFFAATRFVDNFVALLKEGVLFAMGLLYYNAYSSAKKLMSGVGVFPGADAAATRVFEFMDAVPEAPDVPGALDAPPLQDDICFDSVSFSYDEKSRTVIRDVSFCAGKGEVIAIVGGSGAGKTSLVNLIPRFYLPSSGRITIDGADISEVTASSLRRQIGIVTQETILFDDTVFNNIAYGLGDVREEKVVEAAKMANAHDFIMKLPDQYQTRLSGGLQTISGGEQQRIALARAVVRDPAILILDEATSALDAESESLIQQALANIVRNRVTFIIAHRLSTIELADKVVVLNKGTVESIGTHEELVSTSPVYRNLYARGFSDQEQPSGADDSPGETA